MKNLKQFLSLFVLGIACAGITHPNSVLQARDQSSNMHTFVSCGVLETKHVGHQSAQEALYDAFFKYFKVHALAYQSRGRANYLTSGNRRLFMPQDYRDNAWHSVRLFFYACSLCMFLSANICAMEPLDAFNSVSSRSFGRVNNRRYQEVSCFPCCDKKKKPLSADEKAARDTATLIKAVKKNDSRKVIGFLYHGDALNRKDDRGLTALHYTACALNLNMARYLLSTPRIDLTVTSPQGLTALRMVQLQQAVARGEELERCHKFIELIRKREEQQEIESRYIYTMDIGNRYPTADEDGNLWVWMRGEHVKCGTIGPPAGQADMEACVL